MAHHDSAELKPHPYHLVDPSPWPLLASMAALAAAVGAAMLFHGKPLAPWLLYPGLLGLCVVAALWWRDVIREGHHGDHTSEVRTGLRAGMALFIVSEVMFFAAFFWAFFNASLFPVVPVQEIWDITEGTWPPEGIETFDAWGLPFMNTLILLLSGTTVTWAHYALLHNKLDEVVQALAITVGLGVIFSGLQALEYAHAPFGFKDTVFASTFYLATGFHGAHVIIGTIFLAVCLVRAKRGNLNPNQHLGFEFAAWYWHFVDVVWLFLFIFVYWWSGN